MLLDLRSLEEVVVSGFALSDADDVWGSWWFPGYTDQLLIVMVWG